MFRWKARLAAPCAITLIAAFGGRFGRSLEALHWNW